MSTYLDFLNGDVTLRNASDAQKFVEKLERDAGVTLDHVRIGEIYFRYWGEARSNWAQALLSALNEYASEWDIEAKEECCDPVRIYKNESRKGKVCGTQLFYYPGFEDELIRQLPKKVIDRIKGAKENVAKHADDQGRHGTWLPDRTRNVYWVCSCCGFPSEASGAFKIYKYCPNCGAKMDDEEKK